MSIEEMATRAAELREEARGYWAAADDYTSMADAADLEAEVLERGIALRRVQEWPP